MLRASTIQVFNKILEEDPEILNNAVRSVKDFGVNFEDVKQEISIRLLNKIDSDQFDQDNPFWFLVKLSRNYAIDQYRRDVRFDKYCNNQRNLQNLDGYLEHVSPEPFQDNVENLLDDIDFLLEKDQELVILHYVFGYKLKEIAEKLSLNAVSLRPRMFRIREKISAQLESNECL